MLQHPGGMQHLEQAQAPPTMRVALPLAFTASLLLSVVMRAGRRWLLRF